MSYSINIKVEANGRILVEATDCAGGCSYPIAYVDRAGYLAGLSTRNAIAAAVAAVEWSKFAPEGWSALQKHVEAAIGHIMLCLPPPEAFDEDGMPTKVQVKPELDKTLWGNQTTNTPYRG